MKSNKSEQWTHIIRHTRIFASFLVRQMISIVRSLLNAGELFDWHLLQHAHHLWCLWYFERSFSYPLPWSRETPCGEQQCAGLGSNNSALDELGLLSEATNALESTCNRVPQGADDPPRDITWGGNLLYYSWREAAPECKSGSRTQYFFYRRSVDITERIDDVGGFNLLMFQFLTLLWLITYVPLARGIQSTGKVCCFWSCDT